MTPNAATLINQLSLVGVDLAPFREISSRIKGWSREGHYVFFRHLVELPISSVLVCGVYRGMDLALIQSAAKEAGKSLDLVGVDLFADAPCADWPDSKQHATNWREAGFGPPPDIEVARVNAPGAHLFKSDSVKWLEECAVKFDVIYLDTSHDYETVCREITAARRILAPGGILCGDDYTDGVNGASGWGVDRAVQELAPHHVLLFNRIWMET
jgi:hypothetical protein